MHRRSYRKNEVIEENKALLKEKYAAAKALGKQVCLFHLLTSQLCNSISWHTIWIARCYVGRHRTHDSCVKVKGPITQSRAQTDTCGL